MNTDVLRAAVDDVRRQFPALDAPLVRLDGPAGSQTPAPVLEAITDYLRTSNANLGGAFSPSVETEKLVATARERVAGFLGAEADEVGFGMNATAINFALSRIATRDLRAGDEIVTTVLDHDANVAPWQQAATDGDLVLRTVGVGEDTRLDMAALAEAIGERTRIVAFPWANNAIGTAVDVQEVSRLAHAAGAIAWADATHYVPHGPIDVRAAGVDVAIGSAYKFFGPHVGVFYVRGDVLGSWRHYQLEHALHGLPPARVEHGTLPYESLAGLVPALDYLDSIGWDFVVRHERALGERFLAGLSQRWRLHGLPELAGRTATFALTLPGRSPTDLAHALAEHGIAVGAGRFHASRIMDALDLPDGAIRVGFLHYNTEDEVDRVLSALDDLCR